MKAPDLIYLRCGRHDSSRIDMFWYDEQLYPNKPDVEQEYIRKDALMEWAKKKQYESLTIVADNFWQEVIDKINKL